MPHPDDMSRNAMPLSQTRVTGLLGDGMGLRRAHGGSLGQDVDAFRFGRLTTLPHSHLPSLP